MLSHFKNYIIIDHKLYTGSPLIEMQNLSPCTSEDKYQSNRRIICDVQCRNHLRDMTRSREPRSVAKLFTNAIIYFTNLWPL